MRKIGILRIGSISISSPTNNPPTVQDIAVARFQGKRVTQFPSRYRDNIHFSITLHSDLKEYPQIECHMLNLPSYQLREKAD